MKSTWILDLDNTLHNTSKELFPIINRKMNTYIQNLLAIDELKANAIRLNYWIKYGSTLKGLIKNYKVNPNDFLEKTHAIESFKELVFPAKNITRILATLPGEKILYTNAPKNYALAIIKHCNIENYFSHLHFIESSRFNGKPSEESMKSFLAKYRVKKASFVDDEKANLKTAKKFGIRTIWISKSQKKPLYVDRKIINLQEILRISIL